MLYGWNIILFLMKCLLNVYRMFEGFIDLKMYVLKYLICDV